jgi:hypothetical protein
MAGMKLGKRKRKIPDDNDKIIKDCLDGDNLILLAHYLS